jgi:serpin B
MAAALSMTSASVAADFDSAASATNALGVDLYRQLAKGEGNLCLSPYSISCALAMTLTGADGETRTEMARVLHLVGNADADKSFAALQNAFHASAAKTVQIANDSKKRGGPSEPITFSVANRLFPQSGYELRPEFIARAKEFYQAPPESLDFRKDGAGATKHINDWVAKETRDRIKDLIPSPLDAGTRLVLANALYLKAPWADDFSEQATTPEPFHVNGGAAVDVPTMSNVKFRQYKKFNDHLAVGLPYVGGEFQFLILLPKETNGLAALEAMSCGVPVVGSRIGGLPEVIEHEKTGFLCDPNDVDCMKAIVLGLLTNEPLRKQIGQAARERAERLFNRDRIVAQYVDAYQRVLAAAA